MPFRYHLGRIFTCELWRHRDTDIQTGLKYVKLRRVVARQSLYLRKADITDLKVVWYSLLSTMMSDLTRVSQHAALVTIELI